MIDVDLRRIAVEELGYSVDVKVNGAELCVDCRVRFGSVPTPDGKAVLCEGCAVKRARLINRRRKAQQRVARRDVTMAVPKGRC